MVICSNCHCEIEDAKMILHERFCIQNIKYCELCKEAIVKEEYEEHCLEHNDPLKVKKEDSQEEKDSRSLQRVMSSKVACQYCGYFCGYTELEEHEEMCGARTTNCKICQQNCLYKNLEKHLLSAHGITNDAYKEYDSGLNNNFQPNKNVGQQKQNFKGNLTEDQLRRMTSDEQIQYVLAVSKQENNSNNKNNKGNSNSKDMPSSGINYDEIENEYERQMYEDEMKNYK